MLFQELDLYHTYYFLDIPFCFSSYLISSFNTTKVDLTDFGPEHRIGKECVVIREIQNEIR